MRTVDRHLGIICHYNQKMFPPFLEKNFFKILTLYGLKKGIKVTVFSLDDVIWSKNKVIGYRYFPKQGMWLFGEYPLPTVIYDRIFYHNHEQLKRGRQSIKRLIEEKQVMFLGRGLPGKWKVYQMCQDNPQLTPFLPETTRVNLATDWKRKLREHQALFFKPIAGSHGKRVFKLSKTARGWEVIGRTATNQLFTLCFPSEKACSAWLSQVALKKNYIVQPYLRLNTKANTPFDIRILVQKNREGKWEETGRVVRIGKKHGLTSNLHGGGTAVETNHFLAKHYAPEQIEEINRQLAIIVEELPKQLEGKHGALVELGIDVGIDPQGKAWLLEANSKPGRRSFQLIKNKSVTRKSILAPLDYADYLLSYDGRSS